MDESLSIDHRGAFYCLNYKTDARGLIDWTQNKIFLLHFCVSCHRKKRAFNDSEKLQIYNLKREKEKFIIDSVNGRDEQTKFIFVILQIHIVW